VDTRLLEAMPLATHSLFQVIGELRRQEDQPGVRIEHRTRVPCGVCGACAVCADCPNRRVQGYVLEARVARNVDGLDVGLYDEALRLKRQFEAKAQQLG
jgi:hypothetical protein